MSYPTAAGFWQGIVPPQRLYARRRFLGVALDPPDFEAGSWTGAGKALYDPDHREFLLTARPRSAREGVRGFAADVYRSADGEAFRLAARITKEEVVEVSGTAIHSIEGTQLLKNPATDEWHLYLSVDTGGGFVWGGVKWETLLLTAPDLCGPWRSHGLVLRNDHDYDAAQARDATIDIVDGRWTCIYKAKDEKRDERPALATSLDGITWTKHGPLSIDGADSVAFLSGTIFAAPTGPVFMGLQTKLDDSRQTKDDVTYADEHKIGHGGGPPPRFFARRLDTAAGNLETIFETEWLPLSPYEHAVHPLLGYSSLVYDPDRLRVLWYVEAIDKELTRSIGLNETVERVLVYESRL